MSYDRFSLAISAFRERLMGLPLNQVDQHVAAALDFCREAHDLGQPIEAIRAIVEMKYFGASRYASLYEPVMGAVDACFADET